MTVSDTSAYDVVVVGGGPGGYVAAIRAAQLGLRTAVVEAEALGGICVNWGCIPSKALLRSAEILDLFARAGEYGVAAERITADYGAALARARKIAATQNRGVQYLLRKNNVEVVRGRGYLAARDRVAVTGGADGDRELAARNVILATGSRVRPLPGVAVDGQGVVTAREVWNLDTLPRRVVIIGGGPIGVEFATVYAAFGCEVTLVEYLPRLLPLEDEDLGTALGRSFARRGITVLTGTRVDGANATGDAVSVRLTAVEGGGTRAIAVDRVLLAAGFLPNSDSLGLEALGVATDRGYIRTDGAQRTSVPGVYAVGDVTGVLPLAHVAFAQGEIAAEAIAVRQPAPLDPLALPRCTYSSPQVATIGLTEAQAREAGYEVRLGVAPFRPNGKAQALGELDGQIKLVTDAGTGELLGAHMIGPDVTELIGEVALARTLEATPRELSLAVHPHPTLSEALDEAALVAQGRAIHL